MNRWIMEAAALLVIGAALLGWHYRATIMTTINPPASAARPMEKPDVLYKWVDKNGVTHYSQDASQGVAVEYDGASITPMAPVEGKLLESFEKDTDAPKGSATLHDLRRELQEGQIQMQQAKDAAAGI